MVTHAHITQLRPRHTYFSADSECDRSGVAINVIFLIFIQIVTVWILARYLYMVSMLTLMLLSLMIAVQY